MQLDLPPTLVAQCSNSESGSDWLRRLPEIVESAVEHWSLTLGAPFRGSQCAWVAPAVCADGSRAVLKVAWPHFEARDELPGLLFWNGDSTIHVLDASASHNAMLLELCEPGTPLSRSTRDEQDHILANLLPRLWRPVPRPHEFRHLREICSEWPHLPSEHNKGDALNRAAREVYDELTRAAADDVLLATDLHAGNVLQSKREPWLVIDPKPFVGDRAFDATQHLFNHLDILRETPVARIRAFATMLGVDARRVMGWVFVRVMWDDVWPDADRAAFAGSLRPFL